MEINFANIMNKIHTSTKNIYINSTKPDVIILRAPIREQKISKINIFKSGLFCKSYKAENS